MFILTIHFFVETNIKNEAEPNVDNKQTEKKKEDEENMFCFANCVEGQPQ